MSARESNLPTVQLRRTLKASPQRVFDLWTQPALMVRWLSAFPGEVNCTAEADLRVGGTFRIGMYGESPGCDAGNTAAQIVGEYVAIEPPHRLVFTWSRPPAAHADTLVTVDLVAAGNATELTLTHENLPTEASRKAHSSGWSMVLDHLEAVAAAA